MSAAALAARAGMAAASVQSYELDRRTPSPKAIELIASELGVSPHWLLFGEDATLDIPEEAQKVWRSLSEEDQRLWLILGKRLAEEYKK